MGETSKISSSRVSSTSGSMAGGPIPPGVPPVLKKFWDFTKSTAKKFSRHLKEDRTDTLVEGVIEEFKHE